MKRYRPTNKPIGRLMEPHEYGDYIRADDPAILAAIEAMESIIVDSRYGLIHAVGTCMCQKCEKYRLAIAQLKGQA